MNFLISFFLIFYISMVFFLTLFYDIKYRKVPNHFFKLSFSFTFILNIFEYLIYFNNLLIFILGKFFFL